MVGCVLYVFNAPLLVRSTSYTPLHRTVMVTSHPAKWSLATRRFSSCLLFCYWGGGEEEEGEGEEEGEEGVDVTPVTIRLR